MAIALVRYRFRFRAATTLLLFLPMATPEVVLGAGLAAQFLAAGVAKGLLTIILAHTMFCISFVVVTVRARVASLDPALEEAGRDLYASPAQVFWRITFPLLLPGIIAAALLSFALSFDDFIITNFNSGAAVTFPKYVYTAAIARHPRAGERDRVGGVPHRDHRRGDRRRSRRASAASASARTRPTTGQTASSAQRDADER